MVRKKKKEVLLSPLPKEMTIKRLKKLMNMFCIHVIDYKLGGCKTPDVDCNACILRDIPWIQNVFTGNEGKIEHRTKDLCYAVWHAGVLNKNA